MNQAVKKQTMEDEDFDLIRDFLDGNHGAFDRLVLKYQHAVYHLCFRMLESREDADDCAQEAFVKVYKALKHFKFEAKFSTWLYRITVNTCKNKLSSAEYRRRAQQMTIEKYSPDDGEHFNRLTIELADERNAPEKTFEAKMTRETILQAIRSLSNDHKILIVLADLEGYSYEVMTQITGLGMGTLKSRLARARQQLRKKLEGVIRE